jgi:hypothetical protein
VATANILFERVIKDEAKESAIKAKLLSLHGTRLRAEVPHLQGAACLLLEFRKTN